MTEWNGDTFKELVETEKTDYAIVMGRGLAGKTTISKHLATKLGFEIISQPQIEEDVKKKLSTEEEPVEVAPIAEVKKAILDKIRNDKAAKGKVTFVFDGWTFAQLSDFTDLIDQIGPPDHIIRVAVDEPSIIKRHKAKNEDADPSEEQVEEIKAGESKYAEVKMQFETKYSDLIVKGRVNLIDLETNVSEEATLEQLLKFFAPKVILVNHHKKLPVDTTCSNLAIKYNLIYVSVYQLIK